MNNLNKTTAQFLNEVKNHLDNATWDYEHHVSNPSNTFMNGVNSAVSFLGTQKFSVEKIKAAFAEPFVWDDYLTNVRQYASSHDDAIKIAVEMIDDKLAFDRIAPYTWSNYYPGQNNGKKWYIDQSVSFKVVF